MNEPIENIEAEHLAAQNLESEERYAAHDADRLQRIAELNKAVDLEAMRQFHAKQKLLDEERREKVAKYYLQGMPILQIARKVRKDVQVIYSDLVAIREEWRAARVGFAERVISEQLDKIDRYELEANEAWERSKQPLKSTTQTESDGGKVTIKIERHESAGDPRYLTIAMNCIQQRRDLLGTDAPKKTESSVTATVTHYQPPMSRESMAEKIRNEVKRLREPSAN